MAAIPPGAWLGLLGGGQLGRMFCMAAQSLGYKVVVLDPGSDSPAGSVADRHVAADYLDPRGLAELAAVARAATTEFENVPATALDYLARTARVTPAAASVAIAQDRISEKTFLAGHGFAVAPFAVLRSGADALGADLALLPGVVKSARFGYDGKGQARVRTRDDVRAAWDDMRGQPCVLERMIDLACEVSVIVARNEHGAAATWPAAENRHRDGILDVSIVPARVAPELAARARSIATGIADALDYRGVLCVEMFVARDGALLVNEIAPRVHNTGHWTMDACAASQFEQHIRAVAGWPLRPAVRLADCEMENLIGDDVLRWREIAAESNACLHLYGKAEVRAGRKMGHVNRLYPLGGLP